MAGKNTAVFGIYPDRQGVERAIAVLKDAGFRNTDISVLAPENVGTKDLGTERHTKAPEGAAAGAGSGVVVGGILGWLAGVGMIAIPGLGPFLAAGPIVSLLAGVGALGVVGGIAGALIGLGIPEYEAKRYEGRIRSGGILISVHADNSNWIKRAKQALELTGAEDVGAEGEEKADFAASDKPGPRDTEGLPLREEELRTVPPDEEVRTGGSRDERLTGGYDERRTTRRPDVRP